MKLVQAIIVVTAALLLLHQSHAQRSSGLSSDLLNAETLSIQKKVEALFDNGNFDRAYFIYRNELVPIGDKYAQYMVGYMHMAGLAVVEDPVAASAWYRLASERDTPEFVAVTRRVMRKFTDDQRRRSDDMHTELLLEYSDLAVLLASIKHDQGLLETRTGTRVRGETSSVAVLNPRTGTVRSGSNYYRGIERQLKTRLEMLAEIGGFEDIDPDSGRVNVFDLERRVRERILADNDQPIRSGE